MAEVFDLDCSADGTIRLSESELENPVGVFRSFFADNSMGEVRSHMNLVLETCLVTENHAFKSAESRSKLITLHRGMERFLEAGLVYARNKGSDEELEQFE